MEFVLVETVLVETVLVGEPLYNVCISWIDTAGLFLQNSGLIIENMMNLNSKLRYTFIFSKYQFKMSFLEIIDGILQSHNLLRFRPLCPILGQHWTFWPNGPNFAHLVEHPGLIWQFLKLLASQVFSSKSNKSEHCLLSGTYQQNRRREFCCHPAISKIFVIWKIQISNQSRNNINYFTEVKVLTKNYPEFLVPPENLYPPKLVMSNFYVYYVHSIYA